MCAYRKWRQSPCGLISGSVRFIFRQYIWSFIQQKLHICGVIQAHSSSGPLTTGGATCMGTWSVKHGISSSASRSRSSSKNDVGSGRLDVSNALTSGFTSSSVSVTMTKQSKSAYVSYFLTAIQNTCNILYIIRVRNGYPTVTPGPGIKTCLPGTRTIG